MALTDLYDTFARDPLAAFLREIERAGRPVTFEQLRAGMVHGGLSDYIVTSLWTRYERMVKDNAHVSFVPETRTYSWGPAAQLPDAREAVLRLASGKAQINPDRKVLGDIVLAALNKAVPHQAVPHQAAPHQKPTADGDRIRADNARSFAKLAAELEELIVSGASARTLLQRIHAGARSYGLQPIESAGATIGFDRHRHDPVVASTPDGSEVLVVRPGYLWRAGDEEVLLAKAVVVEQ